MLSVTWAFGPPMDMKVPPACHSEDRHEPRLTTVYENARRAVECGSLLPLSLRPACWPWKGIPCLCRARPRASSRDQSGSKLPHSKAPAALNSCVFNRGFAYFHGSPPCRRAAPRNHEKGREGGRRYPGSRGVDSKRTAPGQGRLLSGATSPHGSLARMSPRTRN
jgi:hypothetical protein